MKALAKAPRLRTFHEIMKDRRWHSTAEIEDRSRELAANDPKFRRICVVHSTASDMRLKGFEIACRPRGRGAWEYRYVRRAS